MPTPDLWSAIVQHIDCTATLLVLRTASKALRQLIPISDVIGAPVESARVLRNPKTEKYDKIMVHTHEDMELALSDDGERMWAWAYTNPIRVTRYDVGKEFGIGAISKHIITFVTPNSNDVILWLNVAENGIISLLSTTRSDTGPPSPVMLSVLRRFSDSELLEIILVTELDRKDIMRHSIFEDEPDEYVFYRNSINCFTWNKKTYVVLLPIRQKNTISLLEVKEFHSEWKTWQIHSDSSKHIGCIRHRKNLIYILPTQAGAVFVIDLNENNPSPKLLHLLPMIPTTTTLFGRISKIQQVPITSMMDISENETNILAYVPGVQQVFHLTKTSVRPLDRKSKLSISAFSFIGNDAAVCFMKDSKEYRLYNLKTRDFVRAFQFLYVPLFSSMRNNCIWSIDQTMTVYRQTA
jgi:hypothetical protein